MRLLIVFPKNAKDSLADVLPTILANRAIRIAGIAFLALRSSRSSTLGQGVRDRIRLYGLRAWTTRHLIRLGHRLKATLVAFSVYTTLKRHGILWSEIDDVNDPHFLNVVRRLAPDVILNYGGYRYHRELLSIPRVACVNIHPAPLPGYRGLYSSFWELYNGETESAVSIHFMNEQLDAGPIIAARRFPIAPCETVRSLDRKKWEALPGLLAEALDALVRGRVCVDSNDPDRGAYYSTPPHNVLLAFRSERGGRWA